MTDLVDTLRETFNRRRYGADGEYHPDFDLFDVAADEIERLRARIESLRVIVGAADAGPSFTDIKKDTRHAE